MDISGPILPGNFFNLCQLFKSTQGKQFSAVLKNLQATAPFNAQPKDMQVQEVTDANILTHSSNLGRTNLTFIKCDDDFYSWSTS